MRATTDPAVLPALPALIRCGILGSAAITYDTFLRRIPSPDPDLHASTSDPAPRPAPSTIRSKEPTDGHRRAGQRHHRRAHRGRAGDLRRNRRTRRACPHWP
ncbi:hypothetical protein ACU686_32650 [Yinghuangia aomiensis]